LPNCLEQTKLEGALSDRQATTRDARSPHCNERIRTP
jgi:hypothetical protein